MRFRAAVVALALAALSCGSGPVNVVELPPPGSREQLLVPSASPSALPVVKPR